MNDSRQPDPLSSKALSIRLLALAVAMFGFGFLLVPLYDAFCEVTGFGGKTENTPAIDVVVSPDESREVNLEFVTTVNEYAPWEFHSSLDSMTIHPGSIYEATFIARNLTDKHKIAQAVPSVSPQLATSHFRKLECFCFTSQEFAPGEEKEMLVRFIVDSALPDYIDTITLSYTFFDTARFTDDTAEMAHPEHAAGKTGTDNVTR
jgi:cytochrome c oxidase assembly protein subunit 11